MRRAEIIPIRRLPRIKKTFTYAIPSHLEGSIFVGQIVEMSLRKQLIQGIIVKIHDNDKQTTFQKVIPIKKICEIQPSWTLAHIKTVLDCAEYYFCSPATFILGFIPTIPKRIQACKKNTFVPCLLPNAVTSTEFDSLINQNKILKFQHQGERFAFYKELCAEHDKQLLFLAPQQIDVFEIACFLKAHFDKVLIWNNKDSMNRQWQDWQAIRDQKARIIITTRSGSFLPCTNLSAIIIDQEDRVDYKSLDAFPYYDARFCAQILSRNLNIPLYQTSLFPRATTIYKIKKSHFFQTSSSAPPLHVVYFDPGKQIIHPTIIEQITDSLKQRLSPVIVMTNRSQARILRCLDCQQQFRCQTCHTNLMVYKGNLACPNCQQSQPMVEKCTNCQSLRLHQFGLGLEGMKQHLIKHFPVQIISSEQENLLDAEPCVILTTDTMWKRKLVGQKIGPVILYHPESLLFHPDYRANERLYQFINWNRSIAADYFNANTIIQTALKTDDQLLQQIISDDYQTFIKHELKFRKRLNYPPFVNMLKITLKNQGSVFNQDVNLLTKFFNKQKPIFGPYKLYRQEKVTSISWLMKCTDIKNLHLDKNLKSIYTKVTIDPSALS